MKNSWFGWVIFCTLAVTLGCRAASSADWNGTWKLNPTKGNFQGPIFTISISADGEYRFENDRSSFTFHCDGKDQTIENSRTRSCVKSSDTVLDLIQKVNGVKTRANRWELSADRKVLTATGTTFRSSGPVVMAQVIASRISGSDGFTGQWRDISFLQQHADMTVKLDGQALHIAYPNARQYIDAPFNGVDVAMHGPGAPKGVTYTVQLLGQREILTQGKHDGKDLNQESFALSRDGKTITDSWWNPGHPTDKGVLVYEKQ